MNLFFILFFTGISLYFLASISSLFFYIHKNSDIVSLVLSLLASFVILISALTEYVVYKFQTFEFNLFGDLFAPLRMNIKIDTFSTLTLFVMAAVSIIMTVYIYTSTLKGEIKVSYNKSSFLANLFMIILSFIIFANQSYFLALLISCAVVLIFVMLASDFNDRESAERGTHYLISGNIAVILIIIGYSLTSGMLTVKGFEAELAPYILRNIIFMFIMTGIIILLSVIPKTGHNHVRLLINGLFSKILLFILFRFVLNLFSGNISIICILILLAAGLLSIFYNSYKASATIDGFKWLKHVDLALNSLCFTSIIFSLYADNLGAGLIAQQIRISTYIMILCSIVLYPAVTIIINSIKNVDKSKRFKFIALCVFIPKSLLPPIGGFAGIFMIISYISSIPVLIGRDLPKLLLLIASVFGFVYVYLFYIYAHMKFFINVIDAGYEPAETEAKRKISRTNLLIICFSVALTFITGFTTPNIASELGAELGSVYSGGILYISVRIAAGVIIMLILTYFINSTQVSNTLRVFRISEIKKTISEEGQYHVYIRLASFIFLLVSGTFYSISGNLLLDGAHSFAVLGVMYILVSVFLLYVKDIDFKDLYIELYMMCVIIIDLIIPDTAQLPVKIFMGVLYLFFLGYAIYRQRAKITDNYDRILASGKIYLYRAFFLTFFTSVTLSFGGLFSYLLYVIIGVVLFVAVYIVSVIISINVFKNKIYRKTIGDISVFAGKIFGKRLP